MGKPKFYVVWKGRQSGIFSDWASCQKQVIDYKGARYKSFPNLSEAEEAFKNGPAPKPEKVAIPIEQLKNPLSAPEPVSISVDAACSGNPGKMEYRVVFTDTGTEIYRSKVYPLGTNNIGEFLAIVHALAWMKKQRLSMMVYSDSETAILWARKGKARTKLAASEKNAELFELIKRAEKWLAENRITVPLRKWETDIWGEIPADFGRKNNPNRGDKAQRE